MNTLINHTRVVAAIAATLFVFTLIGLINVFTKNNSLKEDLTRQRIKNGSLLTQRALRDRHIDKLKNDLKTTEITRLEISKSLNEAEYNLEQKEMELRKVHQQNLFLKDYKSKYESYLVINRELEQNLDNVGIEMANARQQNNYLSGEVEALARKNSYLLDELNRSQWLTLNQHRIESVKGKKEKLTVVARNTRKLKAEVVLPADVKEVIFLVKGPDGEVLSDNGSVAIFESEVTPDLVASVNPLFGIGKPMKKLRMVFDAKSKLKPGIYTVEMASEGAYVGSMQVRLR